MHAIISSYIPASKVARILGLLCEIPAPERLRDNSCRELKLLFLQMTVILVSARLMATAVSFVGQPAVAGEMVAGLLLGPSLLGRISPATMNDVFPATGLGPLHALSQLGLVLFMFRVGLDVRPGAARGSAKSVILTSYASIAAPILCGGVLAWELYPRLGTARFWPAA